MKFFPTVDATCSVLTKVMDKPWGNERILEHINDKYTIKILIIKPGQETSLQFHKTKTETMLCISGSGVIEYKEENDKLKTEEFKVGRYITLHSFVIHRVKNTSNKDLIIIECATSELDDVVRLEDKYGRCNNI